MLSRLLALGSVVALGGVATNPAPAAQTDIIGPAGSEVFGQAVIVLPNGNFVVTDPQYDAAGPIMDAGRVYLYNGSTLALINTMTGTAANDFVGANGVTVLANGDYVVGSSAWNGGRGAVTKCSATSGCPATISAANSLVGSAATHGVGGAVRTLPSGNYVVQSAGWDNAATADVGAITWCSGTSACVGAVSTANSLVGATANEQLGTFDLIVLSNGNYVVPSLLWDNAGATDAGAARLCSGTAACTGTITAANSLVGSTTNDFVGNYGITALTNGGYVVNTAEWDNGGIVDRGAVTFCSATGCVGAISAANSLIGSTANDQVGLLRTVALTNGNYVVGSPFWDKAGVANAGAATFCSGTSGCVGPVTAANSLTGSSPNDEVSGFGGGGIKSLTNGNYVVSSFHWDNPTTMFSDVGAVTWCNGSSGCTGAVSTANSLVGDFITDEVGSTGVTALSNGNYVVGSPHWNREAPLIQDAGAATFCNGAAGCTGTPSETNSLVGSATNDNVGNVSVALTNGNYVALSPNWNNGATADVGAATFCSGTAGCAGAISSGNSLVGSMASDQIGTGATALNSGRYVVWSPGWRNGGIANAGAVTPCGSSGCVGAVSAGNSLVGSTQNDNVGVFGETSALPNGDYVVRNYNWDNAGIVDAGAVSYGLGNGGTVGPITAANSVRGTTASGGFTQRFSFGGPSNLLVVGRPADNIVTVFAQGSAAPVPMSIVSRKTHGSSGIFDIDLPLSGTPGVECRSGAVAGAHRLVITFAGPVTVGGLSITSSDNMATGMQSVSGSVVTVDLSAVANAQIVGVTLTNVVTGSNSGDVLIPFRVLVGDTNGNGSVTSTDVGATKSASGQMVTAANFRMDVTASGGTINASDVGQVKLNSGTQLPGMSPSLASR